MVLLAPMAAVLAAAVCLPLLVVLYLLKLRRRPVRVSTIAFWEQAEKDLQANVPLRWIRPNLLLLLHALVVGLIVLALGRPAASWAWLGGLGTRGRVVLLIDNSASMSAKDAPGTSESPAGNLGGSGRTRLDQAKAMALDAINEMSSDQSAAVVSFAAEPAARTRFTSSRALLRDAVNSIEPTDQGGDLHAALKLVESLAASGEDEKSQREPLGVVVFSDGSFRDGERGTFAGLSVRLERAGPAPGTDPDNLGIVAFSARRDDADPGKVRLFVRVQNAGRQPIATPVTLSLDGIIQSRVALTVPGAPGAVPEPGGAPEALGTSSVTLDLDAPEGGVAMVSLGRADALACDNFAATVLAPASRPAILLLRHEPARASDWMLEEALRELRPRRLDVRAAPPSNAPPGSAQAVPDSGGFDLVVLDACGAGLPIVGMSTLSFGAPPKLAGVTPAPRGTGPDAPLLWSREHPVLREVSLDSLVVSRSSAITMDAAALGPGAAWTELARGREGPLIALLEAGGIRHLIVPFDLADSNWPLQVSFPIFLAQAVDYLTLRGEASTGRSFTTAQACRVAVAPGAGPISFQGPVAVSAEATGAGEAALGVLPRAGVYTTRSPRAQAKGVAVNVLDDVESALRTRNDLRVGATAARVPALAGQRELWPWCVIAAGALLVLEWLLYAARMRG